MGRVRAFSLVIITLAALIAPIVAETIEEEGIQQVIVPYSPDYEPNSEGEGQGEVWPPGLFEPRSPRAMYLAQGVEFVFPIGVQYSLANVNEQLWPVGTTGFDTVLEFPKNKIAIMFSSMINTLKIANFSIHSTVYTRENVQPSTALRILGTDLKSVDFRSNYKDTWTNMNRDISEQTGGAIPEFVPRGGLHGRSIYPFTTAAYINSVYYENQWAFPWKSGSFDKFTDSPLVPYLEVEGLMPFFENDAFVAVAALFKSGTGSVVFLKPKGNITILQLMLNPTALTQIFDENFPGWGVKQMKVRVPQATFTTSSQHYDMLVKRGVSDAFCVQDLLKGGEKEGQRYFLNPIVQTNHIQISKDRFRIASVTGVTLNNEKDLNEWNNKQRDDMAPETLLEEYTTPQFEEDAEEATTIGGVVLDDETGTTVSPGAEEALDRKDLPSLTLTVTVNQTNNTSSTPEISVSANKTEKKAPAETFSAPAEVYEFNEPFLWFLHAINEEPMFMGVIESFKRYTEETGHSDNNVNRAGDKVSGVIDKNGWIYEAAKGILWHCPSQINKQTE